MSVRVLSASSACAGSLSRWKINPFPIRCFSKRPVVMHSNLFALFSIHHSINSDNPLNNTSLKAASIYSSLSLQLFLRRIVDGWTPNYLTLIHRSLLIFSIDLQSNLCFRISACSPFSCSLSTEAIPNQPSSDYTRIN